LSLCTTGSPFPPVFPLRRSALSRYLGQIFRVTCVTNQVPPPAQRLCEPPPSHLLLSYFFTSESLTSEGFPILLSQLIPGCSVRPQKTFHVPFRSFEKEPPPFDRTPSNSPPKFPNGFKEKSEISSQFPRSLMNLFHSSIFLISEIFNGPPIFGVALSSSFVFCGSFPKCFFPFPFYPRPSLLRISFASWYVLLRPSKSRSPARLLNTETLTVELSDVNSRELYWRSRSLSFGLERLFSESNVSTITPDENFALNWSYPESPAPSRSLPTNIPTPVRKVFHSRHPSLLKEVWL